MTLYQASEDIYRLFDKVTVLHEGRQIYFGPTNDAKEYFTNLGFTAPLRSTTPDFLTSVTRPLNLRPGTKEGIDHTPVTASNFAQAWKTSPQHKSLIHDIEAYKLTHPLGTGESVRKMRISLQGSEKKRSVCHRSRRLTGVTFANQVQVSLRSVRDGSNILMHPTRVSSSTKQLGRTCIHNRWEFCYVSHSGEYVLQSTGGYQQLLRS